MENILTEKLQRNKWMALAVLCTAQFMVIMDTSIIGVALPAIQSALNYSPSGLQWIFNAYVIAFGGFLLLGGKLSDLYGPKKVFMYGFGLLTAASLFTGISWSEITMNTGRVFQGLGAALIAPSALTLLMSTFTDPRELNKALGFWGASAAMGGSAGVFLGGVLTEYMDWRWTFFINIPIGLAVMFAGRNLLVSGMTQRSRISYLSAALISAAIAILVYTLVSAEQNGWTSLISIILFAAVAILLIVFAVVQKTSSNPLLPLSVFKIPNLASGNMIMLLLAGAWIPLWYFLNLYLQQTLSLSAFYSGLALLPMTVAIMVVMVGFTGRLIGKFGIKPVLISGLIFLTISLFWFSSVPVNGSYTVDVLGASILGALGMSLAYIPGTIASVAAAPAEKSGIASGLVNTTYQLGSAIGLAIAVAVAVIVTRDAGASGVEIKMAANEGFQSAFRVAGYLGLLSIPLAYFGLKK